MGAGGGGGRDKKGLMANCRRVKSFKTSHYLLFELHLTRRKFNMRVMYKLGLNLTANTAYLFLNRYQLKDPKGAVDPVQTRDHMLKLVKDAMVKLGLEPEAMEVGPAINFELSYEEVPYPIDIDLVLYVQQQDWPASATVNLRPDLKKLGVGLVPKVLEKDNKVWQISFSNIEINLFKNIDADGGIRKKTAESREILEVEDEMAENCLLL